MNRLERDRPSIKPFDKFSFKEVFRSVTSPHVIMFFIIAFIHSTMRYGFSLSLPNIVHLQGFSPNATQLLSAGPFIAGFFGESCSKSDVSPGFYSLLISPVTLLSAFLSDRYESRGITLALISTLGVAGFALFLGNVLCLYEGSFLNVHMLIRRYRP
jgi:hypothetical protein